VIECVTEAPHGRVWCEAIGLAPRAGIAAGERLPEVYTRRGNFVTVDAPTRIAPANGPSFVGRLGGGGSHPAAVAPTGDPLAMFLLTGHLPAAAAAMERDLIAWRLSPCDSLHYVRAENRLAAVAAVPPTDTELEALHAAEAAADASAEAARAAYSEAHDAGMASEAVEALWDAAAAARATAAAALVARRAGQLAYQAGRVKDARRTAYETAGLAYPI
jgi:hypothetical protein